MKANELMVGDYLGCDASPWIKVVSIAQDGIYFQDEISEGVCSFDHLRGLPLTSEILEKNGFNFRENIVVGGPKFVHEQDDGRTEIVIWLQDGMFMEVRKNIYYEDEICYTLPVPFFVHELQHALRLVGIKKEIVL